MRRRVESHLSFTANPGHSQVALMIAVARVPGLRVDEQLQVTMDDHPIAAREESAPHCGRIHVLDLDVASRQEGRVQVDYRAEIDDDGSAAQPQQPSTTELLTYIRPSRYVESDQLLPTAQALFRGLDGVELLNAVATYVWQSLAYMPGFSRFTDGAVHTLLSRQGVCRDYAHLVVALLRGLDVPARLSAVYAPGLHPMDFHAVAEAWVGGAWYAVDSTRLAPRPSLLRIATGRDASDTAFLSAYGSGIMMTGQSVTATTETDLPADDHITEFQLP